MNSPNNDARQTIMQSIRAHLAESERVAPAHAPAIFVRTESANVSPNGGDDTAHLSPVAMFCARLESVGGHCTVVNDERRAARTLTQIISELQKRLPINRIALSDAPLLSELAGAVAAEELQICPPVSELFGYDVGVSVSVPLPTRVGQNRFSSEE